ncbi:MAG: 5-methyltetrahydropteroyltriglutamate--homocysteine S-methyltransferase [Ectothiorhodospiraceae bacterium]|nr:5-methyltetrahydropteroyltriglutamate--homocysteine S-methyltransferase [Ectothiorhodospiraceae bacterium]
MAVTHNLGFPRIGARRELKLAVEAYWREEISRQTLERRGAELRSEHWKLQADAGLDLLPVGDFAWYDGVLDTAMLFGAIPDRFGSTPDLDTAFPMARGRAPGRDDVPPCAMLKWFDTNYHYIVPELSPGQGFRLHADTLLAQVAEARELGYRAKPVLLGPVTFLLLSRYSGEGSALALLEELLPHYGRLLEQLRDAGCEWVQLDEPSLVTELDEEALRAYEQAYHRLQVPGVKLMLTTYFGELGEQLELAMHLPTDGVHVDLVHGSRDTTALMDRLPPYKALSLGVVDGRNVWRTDLERVLDALEPLAARLGERLWVGPSCSLLHSPVRLDQEDGLDPELTSWMAYAVEKVGEVVVIGRALAEGRDAVATALAENRQALESRRHSARTHDAAVRERVAALDAQSGQRQTPYAERARLQQQRLQLPLFPVTTIGSFPQTSAIRKVRGEYRAGRLPDAVYRKLMRDEIADAVSRQEALGMDVLVHGEAERNDMVEYFGEQLSGYAFTRYGWVQSYGSRCVKPPVLYGDVSRPNPMTVDWAVYAQGLTDKPMKGMLTGPVTMLHWSFVRDDLPQREVCLQLALALRDEVLDLERAGLPVIQIDEPALREGLPLRRSAWQSYLDWAAYSFRVASSGVADSTQIHTHMCYSEFNDIMPSIAALDADVITIEATRSGMRLLEAFTGFRYPNAIGPGVYDIHSPRVPGAGEMLELLRKALQVLPAERLWANPDCGLKTREWPEVEQALANLVAAVELLRAEQEGGRLARA